MNDAAAAPSFPYDADEPLPLRPEAGDCCNGGCAVCVLEGYDEEVAAWEQKLAQVEARNAARRAARAQAPGQASKATSAGS